MRGHQALHRLDQSHLEEHARLRVQRRYVRALKAGRTVRIDVVVEPNAYGDASVEKLTLHG